MDKWLADSPPPLRLKGLNPAARYLVREINLDENGPWPTSMNGCLVVIF